MKAIYSLFERFSQRAHGLTVRDPEAELDRLALIRIATGVIVLGRTIPIVYASRFYFDQTPAGFLLHPTALGMIVLGLVIAVTVGFLTPAVLILLVLTYGEFDAANQTGTLGSNLLVLLLLLLWLTGAGRRRSLDVALIRRGGRLGRLSARLYTVPGPLGEGQLRVVYLLFFVAFAVISLGAALLHVCDSYWREGYTLQVLFTSSYLSRVYPLFRDLEATFPGALRAFSIVGSFGQGAFQLFMLPLLFTRWGSRFVIAWGAAFFVSSALFLELSYLPYFELLLWAAIFGRMEAIEIFYDDYCNLCKRTTQALKALNMFGTVAFRPASSSSVAATAHGIDADKLYGSLHGEFRGRVYAGYELYELITRRNPLLWIFAPLFWVGRIIRIGPQLYHAVALNRRRIFGTCEVAYDANARATPPLPSSPYSQAVLGVVCLLFFMAITALVAYRFPGLRQLHGDNRFSRVAGLALYRIGLDVPDVFNSTDLRMSDVWPVIYRMDDRGMQTLVPMHDLDGRKLAYPRYIDILYFGNSLRWRRAAIASDLVAFTRLGALGYTLIERAIQFDRRLNRLPSDIAYRVEIFRHDGTNYRRTDSAKYAAQLVHAYDVLPVVEPFPR